MRKSFLFMLATLALAATPDLALAKHKVHYRHVCPTITHYFSWFTTYSDVCIEDLVDADTLRRIRGGGHQYNAPENVKPPG